MRLHVNLPRVPELGQTQVQELGPPRPDLLPLLDQSEVSTGSPPITAHLVLGEGGGQLQPPGRYPGRGGRLLPGEPPASVPSQLRQSPAGVAQYDQVAAESQPCNCSVCSLQFMYKSHSISAFHNIYYTYLNFPIEIPKSKCERQHQDQVASKISQAECVFLGQPKRFQQLGLQHNSSGASDPVSLSISSLLQSVCCRIDTSLRLVLLANAL